jgi:RHS repeat-associated protein
MRPPFLIALIAICFAATAAAQEADPPLEKGFAPDKIYQVGDIDAVDLSTGNLSLAIPIGPEYRLNGGLSYSLKLTYTSAIWDIVVHEDEAPICTQGSDGWTCEYPRYAFPNRRSNAGMGWMLSMGRLYDGDHGADDPIAGKWTFVSPDGAEHQITYNLHDGDPCTVQADGSCEASDASGNLFKYSRDASYFRMHYNPTNDTTRVVEAPDGTTYTFLLDDAVNNHWRLHTIADRLNNSVAISYSDTTDSATWTISDTQGRTHSVYFTSDGNVDRVELQAWDGTSAKTAKYAFTYTQATIPESGQATTPGTVTVEFLTSVVVTDKDDASHTPLSTYSMPAYRTTAGSSPAESDFPGLLETLVLPTGGQIAWDWQGYEYTAIGRDRSQGTCPFPDPPCVNRIHETWSAVKTKTLLDASGNPLPNGTWSYELANSLWAPSPGIPEERHMRVTAPDGNDTVYYFRAYPYDFGNTTDESVDAWDYALPYTRRVTDPDSGLYLSVEYFNGTADLSSGTSVGDRRRTVYVKYDHDQFPGCSVPANCVLDATYRQLNRYLVAQKTVFDDDPTHWVQTTNYDFDGLGHYRYSIVTSSADSTSGWGGKRRTYTDYNPLAGTYKMAINAGAQPPTDAPDPTNFDADTNFPGIESPQHSFTMVPVTEPWILGTYDATETMDFSNSTLAGPARTEYCFELEGSGYPSTGFLRAKRALVGSSDANTDLLAVFARDGAGNRTTEEYFGGDTQLGALPTNYCTTAATTVLAGYQYRLDHGYQNGALSSSQYKAVDGSGLGFLVVDRTIGPTGLVGAGRDTSGLQTDYSYDVMGRLIWAKPKTTPIDGGAWTQYVYTAALGASQAKVNVYNFPNGQTTGPLAQQEYTYDPFGRLAKERQLLADSTWNQRLTAYDAMGRTSAASETQADGAPGGVQQTTYTYDLFGRPTLITPPDGTSHAVTMTYVGVRRVDRTVSVATSRTGSVVTETPVITTNLSDYLGRLSQVQEPNPNGGTITTTYGYDLGDRLSAVSMSDGANTQQRSFAYDNLGLLRSETQPEKGATGNGTVTTSSYDARGHAHARVDGSTQYALSYDLAERLLQTTATRSSQQVSTSFTFASANGTTPDSTPDYVNGKLQTTTRSNADGSSVGQRFYYGGTGGRISHRDTTFAAQTARLKVSWTDLGDVASITYPQIAGIGAARTVCSSYANGWLTGVTDAGAGSCPGTTTLASLSYYPNHMVSQVAHGNGVNDLYDKDPNDIGRPARIATANVLNAGNWISGTYQYDGAGSIKAMRGMTEPIGRPAATGQLYGYDAFGNLTTITTDGSGQTIQTDATTNRLSSSGYDDTGNLTAWSGYAYTYDGFNVMATLSGGGLSNAYAYDAAGERISSKTGATGPTTYSLRGLDGKVLRDYTLTGTTWSWSKDYAYRAGQILATIDGGGTKHMTLDHLGSPRLITDGSRNVVEYHAYWAYGGEIGTDCGAERMKFTGHERDNQCSAGMLDYMHARYYSPIVGKFLGIDPGRGTDALTPQSWNLYAYTRNNPIRFSDDTGEGVVDRLYGFGQGVMGSVFQGCPLVEGTSPSPNDTADQREGQIQGAAFVAVGGFDLALNGAGTAGGGLVAEGVTLGGATVPAAVAVGVGSVEVVAGGALVAGAGNYMAKAAGTGSQGRSGNAESGGGYKVLSKSELDRYGINAEQYKKDLGLGKDAKNFNLAKDDAGNIIAVPVKRGSRPNIETGDNLAHYTFKTEPLKPKP